MLHCYYLLSKLTAKPTYGFSFSSSFHHALSNKFPMPSSMATPRLTAIARDSPSSPTTTEQPSSPSEAVTTPLRNQRRRPTSAFFTHANHDVQNFVIEAMRELYHLQSPSSSPLPENDSRRPISTDHNFHCRVVFSVKQVQRIRPCISRSFHCHSDSETEPKLHLVFTSELPPSNRKLHAEAEDPPCISTIAETGCRNRVTLHALQLYPPPYHQAPSLASLSRIHHEDPFERSTDSITGSSSPSSNNIEDPRHHCVKAETHHHHLLRPHHHNPQDRDTMEASLMH